jgi:hypothetical protein
MGRKDPGSAPAQAAPSLQPRNRGDEATPGTPGTGEAVCPQCNGTGRFNGHPCPNCGATGKIIKGVGGA